MKKYVLAIDQGTTSTRVIAFSKNNEIMAQAQLEVGISCRKSGWVEQNALEIWETTLECLKMVLKAPQISSASCVALGIANQRETTILWRKSDGVPLCPAIVWQSRQSQAICEKAIEDGYSDLIQRKTGLIINPYFSASKIKWMIDNYQEVRDALSSGNALFGTVDCYLIWRLTEGKVHVTDASNASRTLLYNIHKEEWDQELLDIFSVPRNILPLVKSSSEVYGVATALDAYFPGLHLQVASAIGDQQASLFGQCCYEPGDVKNTYGTGCFTLMNTGNIPVRSKNKLLTTIAWKIGDRTEYALEGSVFVGGSAVQWLRDGMRLIKKSKDVEDAAGEQGSAGVYVVPAFVGLGAPYWDNDARGAVFGITRSTTRENFINATVEAIAYQSRDVIDAMKYDAGIKEMSISVDGGASSNNYLMQFQADISSCKLIRPKCLETTALGAAWLAGLALSFWKNCDELSRLHQIEQIFLPTMKEEERRKRYKGWKDAVNATRAYRTPSANV